MDIKIYNLFPTLVTQVFNFIDEKEEKQILNIIKKNNSLLKKHGAFTKNAMSSFSDLNFFKYLDIDFNEKLIKCIKIYAEQSGYEITNMITNSWFNIQKNNSILLNHTHPLSTVSGVIYLKVSDKSSPIYFFNPNPMINFTKRNNENTAYSCKWVWFKPKARSMLLFPSWLKHGSNYKKNKDSLRTVLSFNCT